MGISARLQKLLVAIAALAGCCAMGGELFAQSCTSLHVERGNAAESCATAEELVTALEDRLGFHRTIDDSSGPGIRARLERVNAPAGWRATLVVYDGSIVLGERTLFSDAPSCRGLDETLLLAIALMLDQVDSSSDDMVVERRQPTTTPEELPPARPVQPERPQLTSVESRRPWRFGFRISGLLEVMPIEGDVTGGGRAAISVTPPRFWPIELGLSTWAATTVESAFGAAKVSSITVSLGLCPEFGRWNRLSASACFGAVVDRISAIGLGLEQPRRDGATLAAAFLSGRLAIHITEHFNAHLGLGLEVPFFHAQFIYRDSNGEAHRFYETAPVSLFVELGLAIHFSS